MADLVVPRALRHARNSFRFIDSTGISRGAYSGLLQTTGYGGDRIGAMIEFTQHGGKTATDARLRAQLQAFLMSLKGKQNRVYITDESYTPGGSFPATELFTNSDFSNGTTGWSATAGGGGTNPTLSVSDQVLRATANGFNAFGIFQSPSVGVVQYAPYAGRLILRRGGTSTAMTVGISLFNSTSTNSVSDVAARDGYFLTSMVVDTAAFGPSYGSYVAAAPLAGAYIDTHFASLARCFLADGAGNLLLRSDEFGTSWTTAPDNTVSSNAGTAPDGTATADAIVESNSANAEHYVGQAATVSASAQDYTFTVALYGNGRSMACVRMYESVGPHYAAAWFTLTGSGTVGTVTVGGANWTNPRASIVPLGDGWFQCTLTARKVSASTSVTCYVNSATTDTSFVYAGSAATTATFLWRGTLTASSVGTRLIQSTSAAVAASTQTGSAIFVKGLPASTSGLLLVGDWVEIDGQLKMVTSPLNSDAAGLGYLQFSPPLRRALSNDSPVIVYRPMGRFLYAGDAPSWDNEPGVFSRASIELEEAFAP